MGAGAVGRPVAAPLNDRPISHNPHMNGRQRRKPTPPAELPGRAVASLMADEFERRPFHGVGGIVGEWAVPPKGKVQPGVNYGPPLVIEPPDWDAELREQAELERAQRERDARKVLGLPDDEREQEEAATSAVPEPVVEPKAESPERPVIPPPPWKRMLRRREPGP